MVCIKGWRRPTPLRIPGSVTSIALLERAPAAPIDALRSVSASCKRFFPALTASPNAGRSSAGTLPSSLESSMILLCFPR